MRLLTTLVALVLVGCDRFVAPPMIQTSEVPQGFVQRLRECDIDFTLRDAPEWAIEPDEAWAEHIQAAPPGTPWGAARSPSTPAVFGVLTPGPEGDAGCAITGFGVWLFVWGPGQGPPEGSYWMLLDAETGTVVAEGA